MSQPYYEDANVRLFHGDCRPWLSLLRADVVLTDPPYNCGKNYGELTDDRLPWPEWCEWFDGVVEACSGAAPDVFAFLSQPAFRQYLRLGRYEPAWTMVWHKPLSMAICATPFMPHWEPISYWGTAKRTKEAGARWGSDVIQANVEIGKERWGHPTPKPLALMLDLVSRLDGVILDPFAGSGTTLAASKQLGRTAIGIEINEAYCERIARRLECTAVGVRASANQGAINFESAQS